MPLGKQFRNTFYTDENGKDVFYTDETTKLPKPEEGEPQVFPSAPKITETPDEGVSYQGMLFSPHWGTGSRQDPSITDEERHAAIKKALGMADVESFRRVDGSLDEASPMYEHKTTHEVLTKKEFEQKKADLNIDPYDPVISSKDYYLRYNQKPRIGLAKANEQIEALTKNALETNIPHQMWDKVDVNTVLRDPRKTTGGHYNSMQNVIRLNERRKTSWEEVPVSSKPALAPAKRGAPIMNPNSNAVLEDMRKLPLGDSEVDHVLNYGVGANVARHREIGWDLSRPENDVIPSRFDETGKEYTGEPVKTQRVITFGGEEAPSVLPEGHTTNLFMGKGTSTAKYIATPIAVKTVGNSGRYSTRWYHLRHEAVPDTEAEVPQTTEPTTKRTKVTTSLGAYPATLAHEIGHHLDPNVDSGQIHNQDPIIEGVADGFEDRHYSYGQKYAEALDPENPARHYDIKTTGYSVSHFRNHPGGRMAQAAYVAARVHASMGDGNAADIPMRARVSAWDAGSESAKRDQDVYNMTMALGHMYHHHDHVRRALRSMGFEAEGQQAHKLWAGSQTDATRSQEPPHPTLF